MNEPIVSPSLWKPPIAEGTATNSAGNPVDGAFEIKFLLAPDKAANIVEQAKRFLAWDPFSDPLNGNGYQVESLYLDSPQLDVYHRVPGFSRRKFRIRRYGESDQAFVERKSKRRGLVRKKRTQIPIVETSKLGAGQVEPDWIGAWFHDRLQRRALKPTMQVRYQRIALMGMDSTGPIRITVDSQLQCMPIVNFEFHRWDNPLSPVEDRCVLELKFRANIPEAFQKLVQEFQLQSQSMSKYRKSIEACGLVPNRPSNVA